MIMLMNRKTSSARIVTRYGNRVETESLSGTSAFRVSSVINMRYSKQMTMILTHPHMCGSCFVPYAIHNEGITLRKLSTPVGS